MKVYIAKTLFPVVLMLIVLCSSAHAILIGLSPEDIRDAIKYGKAGKHASMAEFSKEWTVVLGEKIGWATLYTEFHNLAYKARKAAVEKRELRQDEIRRALAKRDVITFSVTVFTDSLYYNYHRPSTLRVGERVIPASFEFQPQICENSDFFPESPYYVAACVYQFPFKGINPNAKVTLSVVKPEGDELHFNFDLSKMR